MGCCCINRFKNSEKETPEVKYVPAVLSPEEVLENDSSIMHEASNSPFINGQFDTFSKNVGPYLNDYKPIELESVIN